MRCMSQNVDRGKQWPVRMLLLDDDEWLICGHESRDGDNIITFALAFDFLPRTARNSVTKMYFPHKDRFLT